MVFVKGNHDRGSGRHFREILMAVLTVIVVLILAEALLRAFIPPADLRTKHGQDIFVLDLLWIPNAFETTDLGKSKVEHPFKYPENVPIEKAADTLRIICSGGSVTRGFGVAPEESYPHQLELALNHAGRRGCPMKVEVLNAGELGGNSYSSLFIFD